MKMLVFTGIIKVVGLKSKKYMLLLKQKKLLKKPKIIIIVLGKMQIPIKDIIKIYKDENNDCVC